MNPGLHSRLQAVQCVTCYPSRMRSHAASRRRWLRGRLAPCTIITACRTSPLAPVTSGPCPLRAPARPAAPDMAHLHVLMINGGGRPGQNFQSHLLHVREMLALLLQAGARPEQVSILNADGADPAADMAMRESQREENFWLLRGTRLARTLGPKITLANSEVPGARL